MLGIALKACIGHSLESVAQVMQPFLQVHSSERKSPLTNGDFLTEDKSTGSERFFQNLIYPPSACMPHPFPKQGNLKTLRTPFPD